jgi:hypothetical protein
MTFAPGSMSLTGKLTPPRPADSVWRYMDLPRFMSLVQNRSLPFAAARAMEDKWEGSSTAPRPAYVDPTFDMTVTSTMQERLAKASTYISSWYQAEGESVAMWQLYGRSAGGVCIKATWDSLTSSLNGPVDVDGGYVTYLDSYSKPTVSVRNEYDMFMLKRDVFSHEREVRLLAHQPGSFGPIEYDAGNSLGFGGWADDDLPLVLPVPVDVEQLIESAYLAPSTPKWIEETVRKFVLDSGLAINLQRSTIEALPPRY